MLISNQTVRNKIVKGHSTRHDLSQKDKEQIDLFLTTGDTLCLYNTKFEITDDDVQELFLQDVK